MKHPIILAAAVALSAAPALVVSYSNGYFDGPALTTESESETTAPSFVPSLRMAPDSPESTTASKPRGRVPRPVVRRCYSRAIEQNSNGGTVRICEPGPAASIQKRTTTLL